MAWFLGFLFLITAVLWAVREFRFRSRIARAASALDDITHARIRPNGRVLRDDSMLARGIARIESEVVHLRLQRQLAEANLQIILSSMEEGVIVTDSRRSIRLVNPAARRIFSLCDEIVGVPVIEALREPEVDEMIGKALATGATEEREIEGSGHGALRLSVHVTAMRDASGELGAFVMFRDLTRLTRLERIRREFVANVSHELRTPLAIFQGYVETLQDTPDMPREEQAQVFSVLAKHSNRLNALVEDLLVLARLESRMDDLELQPFDVAKFANELGRDWSDRMRKRGVTMRIDVAADLPRINADPMRLEQVFTNLLDNALKYTPPGNEITLGARRDMDDVEMWVMDTGQGILSADLPHIFERFYRADKARSRELGGTGLGLSIVKHIAQAHGGSVSAESTFGKGTTVRVRIPALIESDVP